MAYWEYAQIIYTAPADSNRTELVIRYPDNSKITRSIGEWDGRVWQMQYFDRNGHATKDDCTQFSLLNELGREGWEHCNQVRDQYSFATPLDGRFRTYDTTITTTLKRDRSVLR